MNLAENREYVIRFLIRGLEKKIDFSIPKGFKRQAPNSEIEVFSSFTNLFFLYGTIFYPYFSVMKKVAWMKFSFP